MISRLTDWNSENQPTIHAFLWKTSFGGTERCAVYF